jgi:4-hydroxybenzoate polyprenyltransferase
MTISFYHFLKINRAELFPSSVLTVIWPLILACESVKELFTWNAALLFIGCLIFKHGGFVLNAAWDFEIDKKHPGKADLVQAILQTGIKKVFILGYLEILLSFFLFIPVVFGNMSRMIWVGVIFLIEFINIHFYNHPKFKFKSKGILNAVCLMIRTSSLLLIVWIGLGVNFKFGYSLIAIGISIQYIGLAIFASMFDQEFDILSNCKTFPVKYGLKTSMMVDIGTRSVGALTLIIGWYYLVAGFSFSVFLLTFGYLYSCVVLIYYFYDSRDNLQELLKKPFFSRLSNHILGVNGMPKVILVVCAVLNLRMN